MANVAPRPVSSRRGVGLAIVLTTWLTWLTGTSAWAQYNVPSQATGEARTLEIAGDPRPSAAAPQLGWEVGASLDFLMRDGAGELEGFKFTDVVFLRLHGLVAVSKRTELFAGVDLLPKQPSNTDELLWQSALLGARVGLGEKLSAYLRGQGGPAQGRDGAWAMGEAAAQARVPLAENVLFWRARLGPRTPSSSPTLPSDDGYGRRSCWRRLAWPSGTSAECSRPGCLLASTSRWWRGRCPARRTP